MSQISVYNFKKCNMYQIQFEIRFKIQLRWVRINKNTIESKNAKKNPILKNRLSYKEHMVDALALGAEEGRDKLRKATGRCT